MVYHTFRENWRWFRGSRYQVFCKQLSLKLLLNSLENNCAGVSFSIKYAGHRLEACNLIRKNSGTIAFLWILQKFYKNLFCRTSVSGCFCRSCTNSFTLQNKHCITASVFSCIPLTFWSVSDLLFLRSLLF